MKLISAEELKAKVRDKYKALPDRCEINELINAAPTIDAIPVEWLREKMKLASNAGDLDSLELLEWIEMKWHEEQEARA